MRARSAGAGAHPLDRGVCQFARKTARAGGRRVVPVGEVRQVIGALHARADVNQCDRRMLAHERPQDALELALDLDGPERLAVVEQRRREQRQAAAVARARADPGARARRAAPRRRAGGSCRCAAPGAARWRRARPSAARALGSNIAQPRSPPGGSRGWSSLRAAQQRRAGRRGGSRCRGRAARRGRRAPPRRPSRRRVRSRFAKPGLAWKARVCCLGDGVAHVEIARDHAEQDVARRARGRRSARRTAARSARRPSASRG